MADALRFETFRFLPTESRLERDGIEVPLQPKVLDALALFLAHPGELLSKERLMTELWPDVIVGEEALTQVIRKLRQALGDDIREPRYLQTVLKRGYRFLPEVRIEPAAPRAGAAAPEREAAEAAAPPRPPFAPRRVAAIAGAALAAFAGAVWVGRVFEGPTPASPEWRSSRLTAQPEREQEGTFSPDGRSYAFEANLDGQFDLHLAMFAGGRRIRLTETPRDDEFYPQFAADGSSLIFSREPVGGGAPSVWAVPPLGGDERLLVADASYGSPSPDGRELAYSRFLRDGRFALHVRELGSGAERTLAEVDDWLGSVTWSGDGSRIAFVTPGAVWWTPSAEAAARQIVDGLESVRTVAWEPGGEALVHDGARRGDAVRLWRVELETGASRPIPAPGSSWHPSWSRDGRRLLVTVEHKTRQLWRVGADGRDLVSLPLPTTAECFDVDPSGRWLAVNDWQAPPGGSSLELVDLVSGSTRALGLGLCPTFSADGGSLAYLVDEDDRVNLGVLDLASGMRRTVATDLGEPGFVEANLDRRPAWSPDGRALLVEQAGSGGWRLVRVDLASGERRPLLDGELGPAAVSPDGARAAVCGASPLGSGLHLLELAGDDGGARRISQRCSYRSAPVWAADGRTIRFLSDERRAPALVALDLEGRAVDARLDFERPADPAFWGIFDARPLASAGWILLAERYEGDLFVLER